MWIRLWAVLLGCVFVCGCGSERSTYIDQLKSGTSEQRAQAAAFLGAQRVAEAIPDLRQALRDTDKAVQAKAIWALGMLRSSAALPDLLPFMQDSDRNIRQATARSLMQIENPDALPVLKNALKTESDVWVIKDIEAAIQHLEQFVGEADVKEATVRGEFF